MPFVDRVDVIRYGGWEWAPGYEIYWMDMDAPGEPLALLGLVIRAGDNIVVVNSGPDPAYVDNMNVGKTKGDGGHVVWIEPEEQLEAALGSVGVTLEEVTHVIATPFQWYSFGNMLKFPNAQLCFSRTGWIDFHAPKWTPHPHDKRWSCIPQDVLVGLVTDAWPRVRLVDNDEIVPGVEVFWTGVHHRATLAVKIHTANGVAIASDCFMRVDNITRRHPIGINESMEEALTAYTRIAAEADILIPLYDPYIFDRHPGGRIA